MSSTVRGVGWWDADNQYSYRSKKGALPTSRGTILMVIPDWNSATAWSKRGTVPDPGDGSNTDVIRIIEFNPATNTSTQVATISGSIEPLRVPEDCISADLYSDDSIGIVYKKNGGYLYFQKVTYGTWAIGAQETVATDVGDTWNGIRRVDISISDRDVPIVATMVQNANNPTLQSKLYTRRTDTGAWQLSDTQNQMTSQSPREQMLDISVACLKGGTAASSRVVYGLAASQNGGTDWGFRVYSAVINETTGAASGVTRRETFLQGDMTTKYTFQVRRCYLFASGPNEVTMAYMEAAGNEWIFVARATFDGATWTRTIQPHQTKARGFSNFYERYGLTMTYGNDVVAFHYIAPTRNSVQGIVTYLARINRTTKTVDFTGHFEWNDLDNGGNQARYPVGGTGRRADVDKSHPVLFYKRYGNGVYRAMIQPVHILPAPVAISTPADGGTVTTSIPALAIKAKLDVDYPQSKIKLIWQFATDAQFTSQLQTYTDTDAKFREILGTESSNSYVLVTDTVPTSIALSQGTWYARAAYLDAFGNQGAWSAPVSFTVSHPPAATNLSPNTDQLIAYGSGTVKFSWKFTDPYSADKQTAYQVLVTRSDTGATIYDSGQVTSAASTHVATIDAANQDITLQWQVRLWDLDGVVGNYSDIETFILGSNPVVTILSPDGVTTVSSGIPAVSFSVDTGGGRDIVAYRAIWTQGANTIFDSGVIRTDVVDGSTIDYTATTSAFDNNQSYTVKVLVSDAGGLGGQSSVAFTTQWVPPATTTGLTIDPGPYNIENEGYIVFHWDGATVDSDFSYWSVQRRDDMIDAFGTVIEEGVWTEIGRVNSAEDYYDYYDYYAPSGYLVNYKAIQYVNRFGDSVPSENDPSISVIPRSNGYWLIQPESAEVSVSAFMLSNVTADDYTDEWEEEVYTLIGRGRHVDIGDHLGPTGTLTAQIRDSVGRSARQKKKALEDIKAANSAGLYLRNPFGDIFQVHVSNLGVSRIAGVGNSEFCDVSIPYMEIS